MRILFVSHLFPPRNTAGTETYAYNLARPLKQNHRLLVFHTEKRLAIPQYRVLQGEVDGIETRILVNNLCYAHFGETFDNPRVEAAFSRILDQFEPDVVHVHHLMFTSLKLPVIAARRGAAVVMTLHDFFLICPRGGRLMLPDGSVCPGPEEGRCLNCLSTFKYRQSRGEERMIALMRGVRKVSGMDLTGPVYLVRDKLFKKDLGAGIIGPAPGDSAEAIRPWLARRKEAVRALFEAVDFFMTPSRTVGEAVKAFGLPEEKLALWRYGIDLSPFTGIERPERGVPTFGCFGTLMPHKGVHLFVEAAASVEPGRLRFLIRGSASRNPGYVHRLRKAAPPAMVFKAPFDRGSVRQAFEEIDCLVVPSLWLENAPMVIQEAFAAGCPVVASDLGGMRELVKDGVNGRLFSPGDSRALAAVMEEAGRDRGLIGRWQKGIEPPRPIEDDVQALESLYNRLKR